MAGPKNSRGEARVLRGPGVVGNPKALADLLDQATGEMIAGLEGVADCAGAAATLRDETLAPADRLARFADALIVMARPLLTELATFYRRECRALRLDPDEQMPLFFERAERLGDYFRQLFRTHVAEFVDAGSPDEPPGADALMRIESALLYTLKREIGTG